MIFPENRFPPPIKSRTGFFGIMRQAGVARGTTVRHNSEVEVKTRLTIGNWIWGGLLSLIHISEPTRLGMISYAVFCLKKKKNNKTKYYPKHQITPTNKQITTK